MFRITNERYSVQSWFILCHNSNPPSSSGLGTCKSDPKETLWLSYLVFYFIFLVYFSKFGLVFNLMVHLGAYNKSR